MVSPYLCQHCLGETGLHEDLYHFGAGDKAVIVGVCLLENFIIFLPVSHRYHPVHHGLERTKDKFMLNEQDIEHRWGQMQKTFTINIKNSSQTFSENPPLSGNMCLFMNCSPQWLVTGISHTYRKWWRIR